MFSNFHRHGTSTSHHGSLRHGTSTSHHGSLGMDSSQQRYQRSANNDDSTKTTTTLFPAFAYYLAILPWDPFWGDMESICGWTLRTGGQPFLYVNTRPGDSRVGVDYFDNNEDVQAYALLKPNGKLDYYDAGTMKRAYLARKKIKVEEEQAAMARERTAAKAARKRRKRRDRDDGDDGG
jgi:hypothetical protein